MIGSVARLPTWIESGRLTQDTVRLVFRTRDRLLEQYVYWLLRTPEYRAYCAARATGSAVVALSRSDFLAYSVPALDENRSRLVRLLESIEVKQESNRRIARLATELADALGAQALSRAPSVVPIRDLVTINGSAVRPGGAQESLVYVDIAAVSCGAIEDAKEIVWSEAPSRARRGVQDGDVIYSTVRPGRRSFALVLEPDPRTVVSTGFAVLTPTPRLGSSLLASVAGSIGFATYLESVSHGSAYPAVSAEALGRFLVGRLDDDEVQAHEALTMPLRRLAGSARVENRTLTALRVLLLTVLQTGRLQCREDPVEESTLRGAADGES